MLTITPRNTVELVVELLKSISEDDNHQQVCETETHILYYFPYDSQQRITREDIQNEFPGRTILSINRALEPEF